MRCCVLFCKNTSINVSTSEKGISFHGLPSDVRLRAAWLRALGKQHSQLPDSAVVCSQHFLNDEIYETKSGLRQIATGAVPSTVQVCMICLDTDSKLYPMSKHKLEEAYENLTGHQLCDQRNLKHTVCVKCAQRLINFSRFRDKSLRARALMMDLVEKHEFITRRHIKAINRTKNQLSCDFVVTKLLPDHCDLYVQDSSEDKQTESEPIKCNVLVKVEESYDPMSIDEDIQVTNEDENNGNYISDEFVVSKEELLSDNEIVLDIKQEDEMPDPLNYESTPFKCCLCFSEFVGEHAYMQHMRMHDQNSDGYADCGTSQVCKPHTAVSSSQSPHLTENKQTIPLSQASSPSTHSSQTAVAPLYARLAPSNGNKLQAEDADTVQESFQASDCNLLIPIQTQTDKKIVKKCNLCVFTTTRKSYLTKHIKVHTDNKPLSCKLCKYKCSIKRSLETHMRTHTGEKPFMCDSCEYKTASKIHLIRHIKIHSGEKPHTCRLCSFSCVQSGQLSSHMRRHTGEKPFACELCDFKTSQRTNLRKHMRNHSGGLQKPLPNLTCKFCPYRCAQKGNLVNHIKRTHTDEKPFICEICDYKCALKCDLVRHMKTHIHEKYISCELCDYKCADRRYLENHMRKHTGEKPYTCKLCVYKCSLKGTLKNHMRTHTGEKPYSCKICDYKCSQSGNLTSHMRTHTGEKPFTCELCDYKCTYNSTLVTHMRVHTGEKPFTCKLCDYKCAVRSTLVSHMRTHTGEKRYTCKLCDFKCTHKCTLVSHVKRTHTEKNPPS